MTLPAHRPHPTYAALRTARCRKTMLAAEAAGRSAHRFYAGHPRVLSNLYRDAVNTVFRETRDQALSLAAGEAWAAGFADGAYRADLGVPPLLLLTHCHACDDRMPAGHLLVACDDCRPISPSRKLISRASR